MPLPNGKDFESRLGEAESLVQKLDGIADEGAKRTAVAAIQALLRLHGDGFARVLEVIEQGGDRTLVDRLAGDEIVGGLLLLHGLHPVPFEDRVRRALDKVRPYLGSHGGDVEVLEIRDGAVRLRLQGSCDGCPSSAMTLKYAIEQAINEAAPDVLAIQVEGVVARAPVAGFVPLTQIKPAASTEPGKGWAEVPGLDGLEPSAVLVAEVAGSPLVFCRLGESWYAYRDRCPSCEGSLRSGHLDAVILSCPGCGGRFDVRHAGRSLDDREVHLDPVPLLVEGTTVRVATPAAGRR